MLNILLGLIKEYFFILKKQLGSFIFTEPPEQWKAGTKGDIILLPGFTETWYFFPTMCNYLNGLGYKIHVVKTLGRNTDPIEVAVEKVKQYIQKNNLHHVILLSHSKGGITARMLLHDPDISKKISRSFSIATPYGGTVWGHFHVLALHQHTPRSKITAEIKKMIDENAKIVNIYPRLDNHTIPNKNNLLDGATNIEINIVGHTRILEAKKTREIIKKNLI